VTGAIVICAGATVHYLDVNGELLSRVQAECDVTACCVSPASEWSDGNVVVTGHADGSVHMWGMDALEVATVEVDTTSSPRDETYEISNSKRQQQQQQQSRDGDGCRALKHRGALNREHSCAVVSLHISSDQKRLLSGDIKGNAFVYMPPPAGAPM
jgi:WD40 repeat protein